MHDSGGCGPLAGSRLPGVHVAWLLMLHYYLLKIMFIYYYLFNYLCFRLFIFIFILLVCSYELVTAF